MCAAIMATVFTENCIFKTSALKCYLLLLVIIIPLELNQGIFVF